MAQAEKGNTVKVHYTGTIKDGEQFDSSEGREPLEFKLGDGQVIPGFEEAVLGLSVGDKNTVVIEPEKGYGPVLADMMVEVPRSRMPQGAELEIGMVLQMTRPDGQGVNVEIAEINEETVVLDANHPLAGKTLVFDVELMEIS